MKEVKVGQFWETGAGKGISYVHGVKDNTVLSDYRQDSCDSRVYMSVTDLDEFVEDHTLVEDRAELEGKLPSEFNAIIDFYYGEKEGEDDNEDDEDD